MFRKIVFSLMAVASVGVGGWAIDKYGVPSLLKKGSSDKMEISIDDKGECHLTDRLKKLVDGGLEDQPENISYDGGVHYSCVKIFRSKVDWSKIKVSGGKVAKNYQEIKSYIGSVVNSPDDGTSKKSVNS